MRDLPPIRLQIDADRDLVFRYITDFGAPSSDGGATSRVLSNEGGTLLVEFLTPIAVLPRLRKTFRTVERVHLQETAQVDFEEVEGPFAVRRERITLRGEAGRTFLEYEAQLRLKGGILGWLLGVLFIRPLLRKVARGHLQEIKDKTESREANG